MSKASESMFDGKNVLIPLAEVSYILKFQNCIEVRFKDSTEPLTLVQPDKNAFISAWCRYRGEVEADTLMDLDGAQPAPSIPEGWKLVPIEPTPGMMRGVHRLAAAARRVLASADSQGLIRLDESGGVASELRSALAAATEAKPCP